MRRFMLLPIFFALIGCAPSRLTTPMIIVNPNDYGGATTYSLAYNYVRPSDDVFRRTILNIHLDVQKQENCSPTRFFELNWGHYWRMEEWAKKRHAQ
jgi:hypothetical protein